MTIWQDIAGMFAGLFEHAMDEFAGILGGDLWRILGEYTVLFPNVLCLLWIFFAFLFIFRTEWRLPWRADLPLSLAVIVPAHNERLVIARTIEALLAQDYPGLRIHVVSDGSTDDTAAIARQYESRGVTVHELSPNRGKAAALAYALDNIRADLFMVVDADTVAAPGALRYMVQQFARPRVAAVTGNPRVRNITGLLTAVQAMEYSVIISLAKRAEQFWGGLYTVSGAAACFRTEALRAIGGWSARSVTEDIEISWRLQKAGYEVRFEPRALFFIQTPRRLGALFRQRRRWAQGMAEVMRLNWDVLRSRNPALIPIAFQMLATASWAVLVLLTVPQTIWALMQPDGEPILVNAVTVDNAWVILACTMVLFMVQAFAACTFDSHYSRGTWKLALLAWLYPLYYWIVIFPSFVVGFARGLTSRGQARWARTARTTE